jgi:hypothetical protein
LCAADHASWKLGNQSAKFFKALKAAGGELDEIVLDTEIGPFTTWGVADNFDHAKPGAAACALARWTAIQVRKTPSWPSSWANFSLL